MAACGPEKMSPLKGTIGQFNVAFRQPDGERELFELSCVCLCVGSRTPEGQVNFAALRRAYENAFQQFSLQVGLFQSLAGHPTPDRTVIEEARWRVEQAQSAYRDSRDLLAQFMLSRDVKSAAVESLAFCAAAQWDEKRQAATTDRQL